MTDARLGQTIRRHGRHDYLNVRVGLQPDRPADKLRFSVPVFHRSLDAEYHQRGSQNPFAATLDLQLRSMGYYSPKAGVQRGDIDIEQKELAALCGLSHSTSKRTFADDLVLSAYVQRVFEVKRDPRTGRIIKEHYLYVVKMDDVLIPEDKGQLVNAKPLNRRQQNWVYSALPEAPPVHPGINYLGLIV